MKVYELSVLIDQKLNAAFNRTKARDLYDIYFLATKKLAYFTEESIAKMTHLVSDINNLEKRFDPAFKEDLILFKEDVSSLVIALNQVIQDRSNNLS